MIRKPLTALFTILLATNLIAQEPYEQELEAARQEYNQAVPPGNEEARSRYVNKLAQILDRMAPETLTSATSKSPSEAMETMRNKNEP